MSYPRAYSEEIVELFLNTRARGWEYISQLFYLRRDQVWKIFAKDQKLWWVFKQAVQRYDSLLKYRTVKYDKLRPLSEIPARLQTLWFYLSKADYLDYSDSLDVLLFPYIR